MIHVLVVAVKSTNVATVAFEILRLCTMVKMFNTIIFDFDGTIADTFDLAFDFMSAYAKKAGLKSVDRSEIDRPKSSPLRDLIDEFEIGLSKIPFLLKYIRKAIKENIDEVPPFDGILEAISDIKLDSVKMGRNIRLGILTSNSKSVVKEFLVNNNALDYFDFINSESSLFGKHRALNRLVKDYSLSKEQTIYVGDEVRDIEGAKKAGVKSAAVIWGYNSEKLLKKHNPDFLVQNPQELLDVLVK